MQQKIVEIDDHHNGVNFYTKQMLFNRFLATKGNIRVFCRVRPITEEDIKREMEEQKRQATDPHRATIMGRSTILSQSKSQSRLNSKRVQTLLPNQKLGHPLLSKKPLPVIDEHEAGCEERKTMDKLEQMQSSISIDGESKLTINFNDTQGHIPGLSQELSSSRVDPKTFQFDKVFGAEVCQEELFNDVKDVVRSVIDGQKVCIFAYG